MNPQQPAQALNPKQQIVQHLKGANNVLVTVSNNPSVDQLAAAIGTTLVLNKLKKHATAVFSGQTPSTIEFLQPDKTFEKTTDSLRDFIIALDKSKADKLRYKVEDKFVKIFITPYRTTLNEKDLEFSQGDYNVDVVLALGVKKRDDLDQAIANHGGILHDAVVISINHLPGADLGAINLVESDTSSLSEIMVNLCELLKEGTTPLLDQQIATAFLTGIVAETNRFSNEKTAPPTMSTAAKLMNAGANQQLIAKKLEEPKPLPPKPPKPPEPPRIEKPKNDEPKPPPAPAVRALPSKPPNADGTLKIDHESKLALDTLGEPGEDEQDDIDRIHIDDQGKLSRMEELEAQKAEEEAKAAEDRSRKLVENPPKLGSRLTANTEPEHLEPTSDPLSASATTAPILNHAKVSSSTKDDSLSALEQAVDSPHIDGISNVKPGGSLDGHYPKQLVGDDNSLPPDKTAGSSEPGAPPPVPPPLPLATPPPDDSNLTDPNSGIPL